MASLAGLILAKGSSKRLPDKNILDFNGQPMFVVNLLKCLRVFDKVFVSSDSEEILRIAESHGAIPILRDETLCGDVPNIPVYKHALRYMGDISGVVAVQANSPTINEKLIWTVRGLLELGYQEVMTCKPIEHKEDYHEQGVKIYGSIWGISTKRLDNYGDAYKPKPEVLLVDTSVDIHDLKDYNKAICQ